jgi:hypothetical protein
MDSAAVKHQPRGVLWAASTADYFADRDHWSNSALKVFIDDGPRAAWLYTQGQLSKPETKALRFGRLFHKAILEPDEWALRLHPPKPERPPEAKGVGKKDDPGKIAYEQWKADCAAWAKSIRPDSIVPDDGDRDLLIAMQEAVIGAVAERAADGDTTLGDLLGAPGLVEQAVRWSCPFTGLPLRCRWDKAIPEAHTVVDLKSADKWRANDFAGRASAPLGYHRQAWLYSDAYHAVYGVRPKFYLIVVHKNPPHEVAVYELQEQEIELGMTQCQRAMEQISGHMQSGKWHAPEERGIRPLHYDAGVFIRDQFENGDDELIGAEVVDG